APRRSTSRRIRTTAMLTRSPMNSLKACLLSCCLVLPTVVSAQTTAFIYQGNLIHNGAPATGAYEMSFALYDALADGNLVGIPITVAPVSVSNGLFNVRLDFGVAAFPGANRWLEIAATVFGSDQPVTTLVPPQALSATHD